MAAAGEETDVRGESRTVVVSGVVDVLPASRMIDKLTIHFQSRRRSHGGDVEVVRYPTNMDGVAFVTFDRAKDAERVVRKERQIMTDKEFEESEGYVLTVFPFTRDVFLYVSSATVDLSLFGREQETLIQSLQSAHRSIRFRPLPHQSKATIEGPLTAVRALREDLIRRADQLGSPVSAQTAAVKLRGSPLNPRVISHQESVSSVSCSGSKAKLAPVSSNSLSTPLQTTGEVQSRLSNAKTRNASSRRKLSDETWAAGSFYDTYGAEEAQRARLRLERAEASPRQVLGEEINAGIRSSLSGLDALPAEEISAVQPQEDGISQEHTRPDRISAAKIRGESSLGSRYTDYLKESDQSSSAVTAKPLQTRRKDVSRSSQSGRKGTEELPAICPEHPEDTCIWVDSNIFRYIERFDKRELDRCLRGLEWSAECAKGSDLTRISFKTSKTTSRIQQALEELKTLMEYQLSTLRVHQMDFEERELPDKQKLIQICDAVNFVYCDVLYILEDSCLKVIGPSIFSHLFYKRVEEKITKLKKNP
ncbi:uncharacterized protein LOC127378976 [Dicentrarchus labrax]|uniref:RRM domain-containing protein n=1 Tax=Dicentrarchus labrax TaxID=13489 RepID=A0A8C4ICW4_DICLA|nr:uncharacterized protein LOC127378976 [Dicentrarchus labrax]